MECQGWTIRGTLLCRASFRCTLTDFDCTPVRSGVHCSIPRIASHPCFAQPRASILTKDGGIFCPPPPGFTRRGLLGPMRFDLFVGSRSISCAHSIQAYTVCPTGADTVSTDTVSLVFSDVACSLQFPQLLHCMRTHTEFYRLCSSITF